MPREKVEQVVCYRIMGDGTYDDVTIVDTWDDAISLMKAALDVDQELRVRRELMTRAEFDELPEKKEA